MNKKRRICSLTVVICLLAVSFSMVLAQSTTTMEEIKVKSLTDGFKHKVEITYPLTKIVSLAPSVSEMVCAAGICDKLVAVDAYSNYPESLEEVEKVGNFSGELDLETILSLEPDLILAAEISAPEQIKSLEDLGIPVYQFKNPTDLDSMSEYFAEFGEVLDEEETMAAAAEDFAARLDAVRKTLKDVKPVRVFYEIDASDPASPWTTGAGTFIDNIITLAGGTNIAASQEGDWIQVSVEFLLESEPMAIFLADANYGITAESVAEREGWGKIAAVASGAIYPLDSDIASRPGPRLADAAEIMAEYLHPDAFKKK